MRGGAVGAAVDGTVGAEAVVEVAGDVAGVVGTVVVRARVVGGPAVVAGPTGEPFTVVEVVSATEVCGAGAPVTDTVTLVVGDVEPPPGSPAVGSVPFAASAVPAGDVATWVGDGSDDVDAAPHAQHRATKHTLTAPQRPLPVRFATLRRLRNAPTMTTIR
ncbi:MAG: hypothetical protein KDB06_15045 [Ilumatobacter sp.]|nr:hypothetical protein [Ilumatobacter sp.]